MDLIIGFGCGIGFVWLIKMLKDKYNSKLTAGEEEICSNCIFKNAVLGSISEEGATNEEASN